MEKKLTKEMLANMKDYKNQIQERDFIESVRAMPGMYMGYRNSKGFINMIREILQNSIDEILRASRGESPCDTIYLSYNADTLECVVFDNGRGIPVDYVERIFTHSSVSSNYTKKAGQFTAGRHGVGGKATNALSKYFIVTTVSAEDGKTYQFTFKEGRLESKKVVKNTEFSRGTKIVFAPDLSVMNTIKTSVDDVYNLIDSLLPVTPIGTQITFEGIQHGAKRTKNMINSNGLIKFLQDMTNKPLIPPIQIMDVNKDQTMRFNIAFTYDPEDIDLEEEIISFANFCPTISESTHVRGFVDAVSTYFKNYMNKIYLATKKKKIQVVNRDILNGMKAAVSAQVLNPDFSGQAKEIFGNPEMYSYIKEVMPQLLQDWVSSHPKEVTKICEYFIDVATLRLNKEKSKIKLTSKYEKSAITGYPDDFIKPKHFHTLFITEGNSAAGGYRNVRDPETQGIFRLRGKVINPMSKSLDKVMQSQVVAKLAKVISKGNVLTKFKIEDVEWQHIIIVTDADIDGAHIRTLLCKLFIKIFPGLMESKKVGFVTPPLYSIDISKTKKKYFINELQFIEYQQKVFYKNHKIEYIKGGKVRPDDLTQIIANSKEYMTQISKLASDNQIEPTLLELALQMEAKGLKFNEIQKVYHKKYKYVLDFKKLDKTSHYMVDILINNKRNLLFVDEDLDRSTMYLRDFIQHNIIAFKLDDINVSLYQVLDLYNHSIPKVQRYKGLGEMDPEELAESTLYPGKDKTFYTYDSEDFKYDIKQIQILNDNTKLLLKDIEDNVTLEEIST